MKKRDVPKRQKLEDYLKGCFQRDLAERLGVTQGAISHMISRKRDITVVEYSDGTVELHEWKLVATSNPL